MGKKLKFKSFEYFCSQKDSNLINTRQHVNRNHNSIYYFNFQSLKTSLKHALRSIDLVSKPQRQLKSILLHLKCTYVQTLLMDPISIPICRRSITNNSRYGFDRRVGQGIAR